MPWEFFFDKRLNTVFFRAWGEYTNDDLAQGQEFAQNHPDYCSDMDQLNDFSEITRFHITPPGIWRVIRGRKGSTGGRMAVVAKTNLVFGLGRMFEMMQDGSPFKVRIYRDQADALGWLGIPEEQCPWFEKKKDVI